MSITLYALVTAWVLQAGGLLDRAAVLEGLPQAACEAEMRARVEAHRAADTGARLYIMCVPMPASAAPAARPARPERLT